MAISPTQRNQSFGYVEGSRVSVGTQAFKLRVWVGRTTGTSSDDAATTDGTELSPNASVNLYWELWARRDTAYAGISSTIGAGVYLFPDGTDGAGAGTGKVEYVALHADAAWAATAGSGAYALVASGTASFASGGIFPGSYRVVPVLKKIDDAGDPTTAKVSGSNSELYLDSDQNSAFSTGIGSDPAINTITNTKSGWMRAGFDFQSGSSSIEPSQGYSKQPTVTWDPTALGTIRNPKNIRVGVVQDATPGTAGWDEPAASAAPVKTVNQAPASSGAANTTGTYNVDTDFPAASVKHRLRWLVGPTAGQSSTPDGTGGTQDERATLVSSGTLNLVDANDKAWVIFKTVPAGFTLKDKFTVQRDTDISVGSGISVKKTAGGAVGVAPFGNSGRTTAQNLFRRKQPTSTAHAIPFLRAFVYDAFGVELSGVSVKGEIVTQNASPQIEDNQTLTTGTGGSVGNIDWSYTVTDSHAAFNRYVKTGSSRVAGSHAATGPDDASAPPATFSTPNGGVYASPFPAYPKTVRVVGNAYAGTKEPTVDTTSVFGLNSEVVLESVFTCDVGQDTVDANGQPTGVANRSKAKATGSLQYKDSTMVDEATDLLANPGEFHPKDVAGRNMSVSAAGDHLKGRFAIWNVTSSVRHIAPFSESNDNYALQGTLGYGSGGGGDGGFQSLADPTNPGNYAIYCSRADVSAQQATFDLGSSAPETVGYTGDQGNFGYIRAVISFVAIDATLRASLVADKQLYVPGDAHRFNLNSGKFLPNNTELDVKTDTAPTIYIRKDGGAATPQVSIITAAVMTAISPDGNGKSANWEYLHAGLANGAYKVFVTYFVNGSRPPGGGEFNITVGIAAGSTMLICILRNLTNPDRHFQAGDQIQVSIHAVDSGTGALLDLDSSPAPTFFLQRIVAGVPQHLNATGSWVSTVANPLYIYTAALDAANKRWYLTLTTDTSWTNDFAARALAYYRGVPYRGAESREVVGPANAHDKLYTIALGAGDTAKSGTHWSPGQGLTIGSVVQDRNGLVAFDAGTMKLAVGRFDPAIGSLRFLKSDLTTWEATDTPYYHTTTPSPGNAKIGLFTLTALQTAAFNFEDLFIIPKATVGGYEVQATGQMIVVDGKFQHDATNESSIPFDATNGHHHTGADGSRAIGDRS